MGEEEDLDDDDDDPVNNIVVPNSLGADDEDDPIARLTVNTSSDSVQVLHQVSDLVSGAPGEEDEDSGEHHGSGLEQSGNVVCSYFGLYNTSVSYHIILKTQNKCTLLAIF